ncbi:MAG: glycosyltransferase 87 family protein [Terracidiphilus sp.]
MARREETSAAEARQGFAELLIASLTGLMLTYTVLFLCVVPLVGKMAAGRDYVIYWATGQQLLHHANPYDTEAMERIERSAGLSAQLKVGFMRNPPWALPLALPLGLVGMRIGAPLWSLASFACLVVSLRLLGPMFPRARMYLPWLGVIFTPAVLCVTIGQTSLFALLGYVLFLRFHSTRPLLAGMSLWFCLLKPHLFLPLGVVLLVWVFVSRSYRIVAGAAIALAASSVAASLLFPSSWVDYLHMMRTYGIEKELIPCLSIALRFWINPQATWIQYLPSALGCAWALSYYWPRRHEWNWMRHGNLLMLVSIVTAPYCWLFDQSLAIPALLDGAYRTRSRILLVLFVLVSLLIQIALAMDVKVWSAFYLWTAPAWLAWYLLARSLPLKPQPDGAAQPETGLSPAC